MTAAEVLKSVADVAGDATKLAALLFAFVTGGFWYGVAYGSWYNAKNGCMEFDLRPTAEGLLFAPAPAGNVLTKYEGGFTILNWASFRYFTERDGTRVEGGVAQGWINPFANTLTLRYKIQDMYSKLASGGYRESEGIVFIHRSTSCGAPVA